MIRRSPAETYLKYLLLHPKRYTNAQILDICQFVQLDYLGEWYLNKLRAQLKPPTPFHPFDRNHAPSRKFLMVSGLFWIFCPDKHGKNAFAILEQPRVKEFVESMIIAHATHIAIAARLRKSYHYDCTAADIDRYGAFFWNVNLLDSTELRALLALRADQLEVHTEAEIRFQSKAVRSASYKDPRRSAAELPFSPVSALITQTKMGVMPSNLDVLHITQMVQWWATTRALEEILVNGKGASTRAADYGSVARNFNEILKDVNHPEAALRDELATIAMRTDDAALPTIHQLSQGQHTVEVVVMENTNAIPADFDDGDAGDEPASGAD